MSNPNKRAWTEKQIEELYSEWMMLHGINEKQIPFPVWLSSQPKDTKEEWACPCGYSTPVDSKGWDTCRNCGKLRQSTPTEVPVVRDINVPNTEKECPHERVDWKTRTYSRGVKRILWCYDCKSEVDPEVVQSTQESLPEIEELSRYSDYGSVGFAINSNGIEKINELIGIVNKLSRGQSNE